MLPTATAGKRATRPPVLWHQLRRLLKPKQMDFQFTFWTMLQLLVSPKGVYRQASYHKQTKNVWARDDPAFAVVLAGIVAALSLAYGLIFSPSTGRAVSGAVSAVFVEFLALGGGAATVTWLVANRLLQRRSPHPHSAAADQSVEWAYAFDIHCNAFWPLILLLGAGQLVLCPVLLLNSWFAAALSCCLHAAALSAYCYITFLGYSALPFLDRTESFLYPIAAIAAACAVSLVVGFNPTKLVLRIYFGRGA